MFLMLIIIFFWLFCLIAETFVDLVAFTGLFVMVAGYVCFVDVWFVWLIVWHLVFICCLSVLWFVIEFVIVSLCYVVWLFDYVFGVSIGYWLYNCCVILNGIVLAVFDLGCRLLRTQVVGLSGVYLGVMIVVLFCCCLFLLLVGLFDLFVVIWFGFVRFYDLVVILDFVALA